MRIDPATGASLGPFAVSATTRVVTNLHRAFLSGDGGRMLAAFSSLAMLGLTVSGLFLLARRLGGWAALLRPVRGRPAQAWHGWLGRLAAAGLLLSSLTGLWMSAGVLGLLPDPEPAPLAAKASGGPRLPLAAIPALARVDVADVIELDLPSPDDLSDVIALRTVDGQSVIDPATGRVLATSQASALEGLDRIVLVLHTGRGAWLLGLLLGLSALAVPVLGGTGAIIWWRRRSGRPRLRHNAPLRNADTVILVGSEGNATWGFASTLQQALTAQGHRVHCAALNDVSEAHLRADRLLILAATYGDGAAPASAGAFLARLASLRGSPPTAVLGFGDRTFPHFCRYAQEVSDALDEAGWPRLMPLRRIDRQSAQEFEAWGRELGTVLGHPLVLQHVAPLPRTQTLELVEREDYGAAVGAPIAVLRFRAEGWHRSGGSARLPAFEPGDLVGILPPRERMPRFYSLASSSADGVLEICVRLREGGTCSGFLHALEPGGQVEAFIRENPGFRPSHGTAPLILIGAGAGIGPLAGFVRAHGGRRPVHLYWGGRSPASDFLYEHELAEHLAERRLTSLRTAFSRTPDAAYVQDRIADDALHLRELIRHGAQVLVCGGREMAQSVKQALEPVIRPLGLDLATLRRSGRYVEDVY